MVSVGCSRASIVETPSVARKCSSFANSLSETLASCGFVIWENPERDLETKRLNLQGPVSCKVQAQDGIGAPMRTERAVNDGPLDLGG